MDDINSSLIDIFRFVITKGESSSSLSAAAATSADHNPSGAAPQVQCLDLSSLLLDKKIIEQGDSKPWDQLQQILFERLLIEDFASVKSVSISIKARGDVNNDFQPADGHILRYLYGCYYRLQMRNGLSQELKRSLTETITNQVMLYLSEPDVFPDRDKRFKNNEQVPLLLNLISHFYTRQDTHMEIIQQFVTTLGECNTIGVAGLEAIVAPTCNRLSKNFNSMAIDDPTLVEWFNIVRVFLQQPDIAQKFFEKNVLKRDNPISYQSTLLGFMLSVSHLPRLTNPETSFFKNMRSGDHKFTENQIGIKLKLVAQELHKTFHALLKTPTSRNAFLAWIGRCLNTFKDRKKLWSNQMLMQTTSISVNDGFLLNFLNVMLLLSEPFAGPYNIGAIGNMSNTTDKKMLKVDPRYCKWSKATHDSSPVHFLGLAEETFLIKSLETEKDQDADETVNCNFISECFFGTHQAFTFGFRSVYERFFKLYQNISELEQTYASALAQDAPRPSMSGPDPLEMIRQQADAAMTQFYNLKAAMMVPSLITMQMHFCISTAAYLNHLVACNSFEEALAAKEFKTITLDMLREERLSRVCLRYMPEMLVENILDFFLFLKNFNGSALAQATGMLEPLMTLIITFMGHSNLMQNPHLRARFAEILECLMPHPSPDPYRGPAFPGCPELFETHPLVEQIAPALVNVFVSIEMTGEGVQFEQKFSYRRPMYLVLEYLWERPFHRRMLIQLANHAEKTIDSARPPLFLRFVNLLMNDAIFLLDEALSYMNQLREAEQRKKSAEWQQLNHQQRVQAEGQYSHIGRLARFHNVLSMSTIGTIAWLTSEIKTIFCHPTLVDRIANMLNYFLEHLVGPKKGKFNVSDKNDYEFRPKEILEKICQIYINLGMSDFNKKYREFCTAVSSDGRSYSENLLPQATDILFRTGKISLGTEFEKLSQLVRDVAQQNQLDEISTDDIPDTFLDPIMSTLMSDPVLLPSSKIIVDRSTIARHLLSDQTDPFNRSPLSMEDVIPEVDLKKIIETFLAERRQARRENRL